MEPSVKEIIHQAIEKSNLSIPQKEKDQIEATLTKLLAEGATPQQSFEISDTIMEFCYKNAYNLFKAGKYQEAIKLFKALRYFNPSDARYTLGIAASYHYLKDYFQAASNYMLCKELDPFNPIPCFHLYDCLMKRNQPLLAVNALAEVIVKAQDNPAYQEIKEKAILEKENLIPQLKEWLSLNQEPIKNKNNK